MPNDDSKGNSGKKTKEQKASVMTSFVPSTKSKAAGIQPDTIDLEAANLVVTPKLGVQRTLPEHGHAQAIL